ncbi:hypothetical protein D3C72_421230 [compost metagenome]
MRVERKQPSWVSLLQAVPQGPMDYSLTREAIRALSGYGLIVRGHFFEQPLEDWVEDTRWASLNWSRQDKLVISPDGGVRFCPAYSCEPTWQLIDPHNQRVPVRRIETTPGLIVEQRGPFAHWTFEHPDGEVLAEAVWAVPTVLCLSVEGAVYFPNEAWSTMRRLTARMAEAGPVRAIASRSRRSARTAGFHTQAM